MLYYHQAMKHPDLKQFREAMIKEFKENTYRKHWKVLPIKEVPTGTRIIYSIWSIKRKKYILYGIVIKFKSGLTLNGCQKYHGKNYT